VPVASNCLFDQRWWLEAVAPGQWGEVVLEGDGGPPARWPYVIRRRLGVTSLTHPRLTPTLGPCIVPPPGDYTKALAHEHHTLRELVDSLPRFDLFRQAFHPSMTNWMPLYWSDFQATVRYTYRLEDLADLDRVWSGFRPSLRREVRRAERKVTVRTDLGLDAFLDVNERSFRRQNLPLPYSRELVERLDAACAARDARRMFFAVDGQDRIHAAVYVVWDDDSAYYLMGGGDPELRSSGGGNLLVWEAVRFCSGVTRCFDFEGSMIPSLEWFFRSFGARQVPYLLVTKANVRGRTAEVARQLAAPARAWPRRDGAATPAQHEPEPERIRSVFGAYLASRARRRAWDPARPGNRRMLNELYDALADRLAAENAWPATGRDLLDIGCGEGPLLEALIGRGADAARLHGIDLREEAINAAHDRLPGVDLKVADARSLPFPPQSMDAVVLSTVLSSVLDPSNRARVASEATRVLRPGGCVITYDFRVPSPRNRNVRPVTMAVLRRMFPGARIDARPLTVVPQLARLLGPAADELYPLLAAVPFLRTHLLAVIHPDARG
jgi:ubiquinone/menaquinone biosynthesis C-methylase UbiE